MNRHEFIIVQKFQCLEISILTERLRSLRRAAKNKLCDSLLLCVKLIPKMSLFEHIPDDIQNEQITDLLKTDGVRIERIVSFGQSSPGGFWYDQKENEWVLLLEGSATLEFDDGSQVDLSPGDFVNIPAGRRHRVEKTSSKGRTVWLVVFYPLSA